MFDEQNIEEPADEHLADRMSDRAPREVERQVCSVSAKSSLDELAAAIDAADWLLIRAKSIHQMCRQIAITWIDRNGEFDVGDTRYSVGFNKVTRCKNPKECGVQLLDSLHGDFEQFLNVLVAQPFKPGSARQILPQASYRHLFLTKLSSRLIAGVPERALIRSNKRFAG